MPNSPWLTRHGGSLDEDTAVAALLAGTALPPDAVAGVQPVVDVLAALRAEPDGGEWAGEAAALAEFRHQIGPVPHSHWARRRRRPVLAALLTAKAAVATTILTVGLGGVATAAYTGTLPAPLQRFAHKVIGAPAASPAPSPSPAGSQPVTSASRPGTAVPHHRSSPSPALSSSQPNPNPGGQPSPHPTGKPTSHPSGGPTPHPTGKPTSPPGKPTSRPLPIRNSHASTHPTGQPASHP